MRPPLGRLGSCPVSSLLVEELPGPAAESARSEPQTFPLFFPSWTKLADSRQPLGAWPEWLHACAAILQHTVCVLALPRGCARRGCRSVPLVARGLDPPLTISLSPTHTLINTGHVEILSQRASPRRALNVVIYKQISHSPKSSAPR